MKKPNDIEPYVFIMGHSMPRSELIRLIVIVAFILAALSVGGFVYYQDLAERRSSKVEIVKEVAAFEEAAAKEKLEALTPLQTFFNEYLALTRIGEVTSIRAVGIYEVDGNELQFTLLARNPRMYKYVLRVERGPTIEFGYDGQNAWFQQTQEVVDEKDAELTRLNKTLAILESSVPCLAWDYDHETVHRYFELMSETQWNGLDCYVIKNKRLIPGTPVYHYIEKATGFEHYRRASIQISERRYRDAEIFYAQPLAGAEYPLPGGIELLLDGRVGFKATFEKVEINQGLAKFLFEEKELD